MFAMNLLSCYLNDSEQPMIPAGGKGPSRVFKDLRTEVQRFEKFRKTGEVDKADGNLVAEQRGRPGKIRTRPQAQHTAPSLNL